jgi:hypothetical protein
MSGPSAQGLPPPAGLRSRLALSTILSDVSSGSRTAGQATGLTESFLERSQLPSLAGPDPLSPSSPIGDRQGGSGGQGGSGDQGGSGGQGGRQPEGEGGVAVELSDSREVELTPQASPKLPP